MSPLQKEQQSRLNALTSADRDVFDCLTFVEEVLALSLPPDPLEAPTKHLQ